MNGTANGNEASPSNAATNEADDDTNSNTAPKNAFAMLMAKRSKRARKDVDYAELN